MTQCKMLGDIIPGISTGADGYKDILIIEAMFSGQLRKLALAPGSRRGK